MARKREVNLPCPYSWHDDEPCRHHQGRKDTRASHHCNETAIPVRAKEYEEAIADRSNKFMRLTDLVKKQHKKHRCSCGVRASGWRS